MEDQPENVREQLRPLIKDRLRTVRERLETIRAEMRELNILNDLDKIGRCYAVANGVWKRISQTDDALREVEMVKRAVAQLANLSQRSIDAIADNSDALNDDGSLGVREWLSYARKINGFAERAEMALLAKRRRAEPPQIQQWLIGKLPVLYAKAFGVDFPAGSRKGPGVDFINKCLEYFGLTEIEDELLGLNQDNEAPADLRSDPRPLPGETIKTLLRAKRKNDS